MDKTIAIIGFVQALFGIIIFITKRPWHICFIFLTIWMAIISIFQGATLLPFQVVEYFRPGIFPIMFLFGPLLYLYVSSLAVEDFRLKLQMLVHLLPLLAVSVHRSVVGSVPIGATNLTESTHLLINNIYYGLLVISMLVYWIFSLRIISVHRKNIPNHFSNYTSKNSLGWLISVLTLFMILFVVDFSLAFIKRALELGFGRISYLSLNLTVFTFVMIFFGINQSVIYKTRRVLKDESEYSVNQENHEARYSRSLYNEKQIEELTNIVFQYLKNKKPYLNPDYSLQMMCEDLNISRHKLSEAINSGQKKNFYKLINEFRVEEVKEMLVNPAFRHYTVLGIGLECGFNSKTSFNRIFKEETGLTPTEYKRTI